MSGTILITGAGTRIGSALAKGLANDGWHVAVHYNRSRDGADDIVASIEKMGGNAVSIGANLNVPSNLDTLIDRAAEALGGPVTALINNASTFEQDSAQDFTNALFDHHMDVNLRAPLILSQHLAAQLPNDRTGAVINIIDNRVLKPKPGHFTYAISKAGLHWATQTMAQSFAPHIRVNAIGPGPTLQNKSQTKAEFDAEKQATLLGTGSPPDTILQAARYLLAATSVTGQMIAVDGGQHLSRG